MCYQSIDWVRFPISVTLCLWNIRLQKCCDLENRVRGPSMSLEMSPFDRAHMTSYCRSLVTMALFSVVSEICNVEKCRDLEIRVRGHSRSSEGHVSIRHLWFPINVPEKPWAYLVPFPRQTAIKSQFFPLPVYFATPLKGVPWELGIAARGQKL